eukprot:m.60264 g.60264  ORF g.60264 m.60264 type:complete len:303 (-) comp13648_c0_seq1:186-1094(-)
MGKHGRNATANPIYSYHERRLDAMQEGYGTTKKRLGSDSLRDTDHCCLSLQPARDPVITPEGYLYDREAILEGLLHQKREIARKMKEYERQRSAHEREQGELEAAAQRDRIEAFAKQEKSVAVGINDHFKERDQELSHASKQLAQPRLHIHTTSGKKEAALPAFWLPSLTPDAKPTLISKPDEQTRCPMTGNVLKIKDLISVKFTPIDPTDKNVLFKEERWKCPITHTVFKKGTEAYVLRPSGRVVSKECVEKVIRPEMVDPISGEKLKESDLIPIKNGGTGFAASGAKLEVKVTGPSLATS